MPEIHIPPTEFNVELTQAGVKAAIAESGAVSRDLLMVPIDQLKTIAGLNIRIQDGDYAAKVDEIATSIAENGFYPHKPLSGYAGKEGSNTFIFVTGGFTRLAAAKQAIAAGVPIERLPVVLKPAGTSMADLTIALAIDNTGAPLKPYERAIVIKRLVGYGFDEPTIARRMGIGEQYVKDLLFLMSLPQALQGMVIAGNVSAHTVVTLARRLGTADALKQLEAGEHTGDPFDAPAAATDGQTAAAPAAGGSSRGAQRRAATAVIPKKLIFRAIDYTLSLSGGGLKWLAAWRAGEETAVAELLEWKPPRRARKAKTAAKPAAGRKSRKAAARVEPEPL